MPDTRHRELARIDRSFDNRESQLVGPRSDSLAKRSKRSDQRGERGPTRDDCSSRLNKGSSGKRFAKSTAPPGRSSPFLSCFCLCSPAPSFQTPALLSLAMRLSLVFDFIAPAALRNSGPRDLSRARTRVSPLSARCRDTDKITFASREGNRCAIRPEFDWSLQLSRWSACRPGRIYGEIARSSVEYRDSDEPARMID